MAIRFGVEIETHMPVGACDRGPHGRGRQVAWLPPGWLADADPSIVPPNASRVGVEFVSPILEGADGLRQLQGVIAEIKARGGQVNASCGLHVHVDFDKTNAPAVAKLLKLVANHEQALYAVTGTLSRERGVGSRYATNWCKSVKQYGRVSRAIRAALRDRYHLLNIATTKPTVEFRVFGASLNPTKILAWIRLCVGLVEKANESAKGAPWNHKAAAGGLNGTSGEGEKEVARLLFSLGWTYDGFGTRAFGRKKFGLIDGIGVDLSAAIAECMRLAKKYDAARREAVGGNDAGGSVPPAGA
jgi:hypothetical protein